MNAICWSRLADQVTGQVTASRRNSKLSIPPPLQIARPVSAITLSRIAAAVNILFRFGDAASYFLALFTRGRLNARFPPISSSLFPHVRARKCIVYIYIYMYVFCSNFSSGNLRRFLLDEYLSTRFYRCLRIGGMGGGRGEGMVWETGRCIRLKNRRIRGGSLRRKI